MAQFDKWLVVVSGPKMVDDLRKRPDDEASFTESVEEARLGLGLVMLSGS